MNDILRLIIGAFVRHDKNKYDRNLSSYLDSNFNEDKTIGMAREREIKKSFILVG